MTVNVKFRKKIGVFRNVSAKCYGIYQGFDIIEILIIKLRNEFKLVFKQLKNLNFSV